MAEEIQNGHATVEVPAGGGGHGEAAQSAGPFSLDVQMVVWTWVTFAVVAIILSKVAWKPILASLDAREGRIRKALEDAQKAEESLAGMEVTRKELLAKTEAEARSILAKAREEAIHTAQQMEARAQEKARILYETAEREIGSMKNKAVADFRHEQLQLVIDVAGRLVSENMDTERNRTLTEKLIKEL